MVLRSGIAIYFVVWYMLCVKRTRPRRSMDRIQVCGTCDAGSIPAEGI